MSNSYSTVITVPAPPNQVLETFLTAFNGSGAIVTLSGPNGLVITRRYTPTWALIVGIIGILFFLLGILAFFIKESEVLTVALSPEAEGKHTRVVISGVAGADVAARINHVIVRYQRLPESSS